MKRLLLVAALALTGCRPNEEIQSEAGEGAVDANPISSNQFISRYYDDEAGVVCWVYSAYGQGGISCLPYHSTDLGVAR